MEKLDIAAQPSYNGVTLSLIVPCYNEEQYLEECIETVLKIQDRNFRLEIIIVDDKSTDRSLEVARRLENTHPEIRVLRHERNRGKGAALRTGFNHATGDIVAVQDADLEYDPKDLKRLIVPIVEGRADVVLGSRFLSSGEHRVLYFWHSMLNKFLTFVSNMFSDLNLTDMETCYKVFRREVIQAVNIEEDRFGFEPEIVAKVAQMRVRIVEMGISYYGRTYEEGKKIGWKDGARALYCIFHYSASRAPLPLQAIIYILIGAASALVNLATFIAFARVGMTVVLSASIAYMIAAAVNYLLCIAILFRHRARWSSMGELSAYMAVVAGSGVIDVLLTAGFVAIGLSYVASKVLASVLVLIVNFFGRKYVVFPERAVGVWRPQVPEREYAAVATSGIGTITVGTAMAEETTVVNITSGEASN